MNIYQLLEESTRISDHLSKFRDHKVTIAQSIEAEDIDDDYEDSFSWNRTPTSLERSKIAELIKKTSNDNERIKGLLVKLAYDAADDDTKANTSIKKDSCVDLLTDLQTLFKNITFFANFDQHINTSTFTHLSHSDSDSIAEFGSLDKSTGVESEESAVFRQLLIPTKMIQASVLDIFLTNISKKDSDECEDFWIGSENYSFSPLIVSTE